MLEINNKANSIKTIETITSDTYEIYRNFH